MTSVFFLILSGSVFILCILHETDMPYKVNLTNSIKSIIIYKQCFGKYFANFFFIFDAILVEPVNEALSRKS